MTEVRNRKEGSLRWEQASGSGTSWATASAPASGLMSFVTNFTLTSAHEFAVIDDRGTLSHNKSVRQTPVDFSFDVKWGVTAVYPPTTVTGSGATVPMVHLEYKATAPEDGKSVYFQIHGCPIANMNFSEGDEFNAATFAGRGLAIIGPTASGYLG